MTTDSWDRFGPTPWTLEESGFKTDAEIDEESALESAKAKLAEDHAAAFQIILDAAEEEYGWDGMPDVYQEMASELGVI